MADKFDKKELLNWIETQPELKFIREQANRTFVSYDTSEKDVNKRISVISKNELNINKAKPNLGHQKIAQIMEKKELSHLITQNVDNLHQESGVSDDRITELHGNATYAKCLDCHLKYDLSKLK